MSLDYLNYIKKTHPEVMIFDKDLKVNPDGLEDMNTCIEEAENFEELKEVLLHFTNAVERWRLL
ncbi:hypothetical protein EVB55_238 [Rhizobium phage RHph_Y68]|uniref:Uncharacterized protein n=1 Tax=Rhizobium phage RHph_Y68 TaxID=2509787 RepID=A0A7S5QY77_9CAUD|nr:hypothetical protein PP934_gp238 [Rhizobium phage RHph_Y68]QIG68173.1 hypothetical protein EVB55_238 [Rhizobium phage RHph_Y68]